MNAGDIVYFTEPKRKTRKGKKPDAFRYSIDGETYVFPFGKHLKVSSNCDPDNKVASLNYPGDYPLIRKEFANKFKQQITIHEKAETYG